MRADSIKADLTRSGVNGPMSSVFVVNFGVPAGGGSIQAFVTEQASGAKLAA